MITRFEIEPAVGAKGSQVMNLVKDLARPLSVVSIRVVETVPGKTRTLNRLGNPKRQTVRLSEIPRVQGLPRHALAAHGGICATLAGSRWWRTLG